MSVAPVRATLLYLGLVGVPLAGLVGVLHAGIGLGAPPAISGEWVIDAGACAGIERLTIGQSGRFLQVRAGDAASEGRLDGDHITATVRAGEGACAGAAISLDGVFADGALTGELRSDSCAACSSSTVHARRAEP